MRKRFCATMRKPDFSIIALMAPVTLRAVASGLMIENVRSIAIGSSFVVLRKVRLTKALRKPDENVPAYSLRSSSQQAREIHPERCDKDHVLVESGRIISQ